MEPLPPSDIDAEMDRSQTTCRVCPQVLDPEDAYCRRCGARRDAPPPLTENRLFVLGLLFLGIGPLALPLLWRSRAFTPSRKFLISIVNLVFFVALLGLLMKAYLMYTDMLMSLGMGG